MLPARHSTAVLVVLTAALPTLAGCGQGPAPVDGVSGTLRLVSDTGRGSFGLDEGWVFTLPAGDAASWELLDVSRSEDLERVRRPIEPDDVAALGGAWQDVDSGRFALPVDAGEHLLCWAIPPDSGPATALLRGCAELTLAADSSVTATWGEAGFRATVD